MEIEYSNSEQETLRIGEKIGRELHLPQVILLYGELGSGKTVLVRGLARGLGVTQDLRAAEELFAYAIGGGEDSAMYSAGLLQTILPDGDLVTAAMWGLLAEKHDPDGQGHRLIERLTEHLSRAQQADAQRRAQDWVREERTVAWMVKRAA